MKVMLKRLLISTLLFFLILTSFASFLPSKVRAQAPPGPWYDQTFQEWYSKVYDEQTSPPTEIFGERYTAAQVQWVIYGLFAFLIRQVPSRDAITCLMNHDIADCIGIIEGMLASGPNQENLASSQNKSFLAAIFADRPLSGIGYFKEKLSKFHIVPEVKAQGFGFQGLNAVQGLWQAARNITYALFIFVIIFMAFMIMFRVKISPQTVISVQSALPKIVIALFLVTFSYAIAGFMVDLMYVVIGLISLMLAKTGSLFSSNPFTMFEFLTKGTIAGFDIGAIGLLIVYLLLFALALFMVLLFGNGLLFTLVEGVITLGTGPVLYLLISLVAFIILIIVLLFVSFKITWMLFKTFANILLLTIFAPFQIALGTLTSEGGFGAWLKNFASNLAVFPVTGVLFALAYIFLLQAYQAVAQGLWNLPSSLLDIFRVGPLSLYASQTGWPPLLGLGQKSMSLLLLAVSLGILLLIPKVADLIKGLITGRPLAYGTAIGEAFGPVGAAWGRTGAPITGAYQRISSETMVQNLASQLAKSHRLERLPKFIQTTVKGMAGQRGTDQGGRV